MKNLRLEALYIYLLNFLFSYEDGDWKVSVTTGSYENCGTSSNVMFYACGSGGTSSGPIFLGSGTKGLFAAGTTEQFKV